MNTVAGWNSMQRIGRRYQQMFPQVLSSNYSQERYLFRHADTQRSRASISAFAGGVFGENGWEGVNFEPIPERDTFLRPIHFCPAFTEVTANQPQQDAFEQGPEIETLLEEVNRKLGLRGSSQLSFNQILLIWEWCRFETGSESGTGAWCVPFSVSHHAILEYYRDLGYYHFTGYGVPNQRLIENLNCGLVQDMLTTMQSNDPTDQTVKIFSSFSQIVQAFLVTLGAFRDEDPLHQHNYAQQSFRNWKSSFLTPNAANLVIVRYE